MNENDFNNDGIYHIPSHNLLIEQGFVFRAVIGEDPYYKTYDLMGVTAMRILRSTKLNNVSDIYKIVSEQSFNKGIASGKNRARELLHQKINDILH